MKKKYFKGIEVVETSQIRIPKEKRKENVYYYDIRHSDEDGFEPATIEKFVLVNYFATIGLAEPINFDEYMILDDTDAEAILLLL